MTQTIKLHPMTETPERWPVYELCYPFKMNNFRLVDDDIHFRFIRDSGEKNNLHRGWVYAHDIEIAVDEEFRDIPQPKKKSWFTDLLEDVFLGRHTRC